MPLGQKDEMSQNTWDMEHNHLNTITPRLGIPDNYKLWYDYIKIVKFLQAKENSHLCDHFNLATTLNNIKLILKRLIKMMLIMAWE